MALVKKFGEMWARNGENIKAVPGSKEGGKGVYVLYDGPIPIYFGRGNIRSRIKRHNLRRSWWDHFSWYALTDPALAHDVESLLLRATEGFYARPLNRQNGKFEEAEKNTCQKESDRQLAISRAKLRRKRATSK